MKQFSAWCRQKERIDALPFKPRPVHAGEVWWARVGENIGSEMSGKGEQFTRPMVILSKPQRGLYFAIPTTTQHHTNPWIVPIVVAEKPMRACLHQAKTIDCRRVTSRIGRLSEAEFALLIEQMVRMMFSYK